MENQTATPLHDITQRVSMRKSHPNLYKAFMVFSIMFIALAINLYLTKPTFAPYGLPKDAIATVFLVLGVSKIIFLNFYHNLKVVRLLVAIATAFMVFWGVSNTQQAFAGKASFQLPILFVSLAILNLFLLIEPASNPMTSNSDEKEKK